MKTELAAICCLTALAACSSDRRPGEGSLASDLSTFLEESVKALQPEAHWRVYSHGGGWGLAGGEYSYAHVESLRTSKPHGREWGKAALMSLRDEILDWLESGGAKLSWKDSGPKFSFGAGDGYLCEYRVERGLGWVSPWLFRTDDGRLGAHFSVTEHLR
ncbi:MAG: hypothetical protein ACYTDY_11485 [Planctomycetota bacterium]|jgi:hypothetical protein